MQKKIYFASDLHLGAPNPAQSRIREKHFINWLRSIEHEVAELILLGDIFDFWFEYKRAIPKGFVRLLGTLADFTDKGIPVHLFSGNHDLWFEQYLPEEIGVTIHKTPQIRAFFGRTYYFAHGDGLGPGDHGYKMMKKVVTHRFSQWMFHRFHPNFGIGLAHLFSDKGGNHNYENVRDHEARHRGQDDYLYHHSREVLATQEIDCFIYGHRHVMVQEELSPGCEVVILGDWIQYFSYLEISPEGHQLDVYTPAHQELS